MTTLDGTDLAQPVSDIQLSQLVIEWVPYASVRPNKYNPNKMTWDDRMLLRQSLLEDGWTQPIVTLPDGTIVDGEQRWTTAGIKTTPADVQAIIDKMEKRATQGAVVSESIISRLRESMRRLEAAVEDGHEPTIAAITRGLVPITRINLTDDAHKMIATIRHNRARGTHAVSAMASITQDLAALGLDVDDLRRRLGMDDEEIRRLRSYAEGQSADLRKAIGSFTPAWEPRHIRELSPEAREALSVSASAAASDQPTRDAAVENERERRRITAELEAEFEAEHGVAPNAEQKEAMQRKAAAQVGRAPTVAAPRVRKISILLTHDEYNLVVSVLGDAMASALVDLCREEASRRAAPTSTARSSHDASAVAGRRNGSKKPNAVKST